MWRGAFGVSGIAWPGFIAKEMVNGRTPAVAFLRCGGVEGHVRTKMVVPVEVQFPGKWALDSDTPFSL